MCMACKSIVGSPMGPMGFNRITQSLLHMARD